MFEWPSLSDTIRMSTPATILLVSPVGRVVPEVVAGLAAAGVALAAVRRSWRLGEVRVAVGLAVIGLAAALIAWQGDGIEVARHTIEGKVETRLGVLLLLLLAVLTPTRPAAQVPLMTE